MSKSVLVAIGGNALVREGERSSIQVQMERCAEVADHIAGLVEDGWKVVLTHGNGPQVGHILRRGELVEPVAEREGLPELPLWLAVASSQGEIGHLLGVAVDNALRERDLSTRTVTVVTHAAVDPDDPAFDDPQKPIGSLLDLETARQHADEDWHIVKVNGGYRRVVPSPRPRAILESEALRHTLDGDAVLIAGGGGGIPVVDDGENGWHPIDAVIDKDRTSTVIASDLGLDTLVLVTGVPKVQVGFGTTSAQTLDEVTRDEAERYMAAGEFPPGSMGPKVEASLEFLAQGGGTAVITSLDQVREAVAGRAGTRFV